jgi:large subunit ribosomal protein L22
MTGVKTNERPGTRAQAKFVRSSAYKAREILDLIRGKSYGRATEILMFSERSIAQTIQKCVDSAVANAEHNDQIPGEELYIAACFADEGPTLKRWRPRARGRATRIRKRTCHITVIVARYEPEILEAMRERDANRGGTSAAAAEARRRRVERSRQREADAEHDHDHDDDEAEDEEVDETVNVDELVDATFDALSEDDTAEASDEAVEATEQDDAAEPEASSDQGGEGEEAGEAQSGSGDAEAGEEATEPAAASDEEEND